MQEWLKRAGLLILNKNPLIDINNTRVIDTVFLNGHVYGRDKLDAMLAEVKDAHEASRKINVISICAM